MSDREQESLIRTSNPLSLWRVAEIRARYTDSENRCNPDIGKLAHIAIAHDVVTLCGEIERLRGAPETTDASTDYPPLVALRDIPANLRHQADKMRKRIVPGVIDEVEDCAALEDAADFIERANAPKANEQVDSVRVRVCDCNPVQAAECDEVENQTGTRPGYCRANDPLAQLEDDATFGEIAEEIQAKRGEKSEPV